MQTHESTRLVNRAKVVIWRLEKLAADSSWQHRSSGLRGSLLKSVEQFEGKAIILDREEYERLEALIHQGLDILGSAAKEIPDPDAR
jgi:hypothetical protein